MKNAGSYYIIVIEDTSSGKIIATATLVVEQKFIHNCALVCLLNIFLMIQFWKTIKINNLLQRGRLEDVVVNNKYRGKHLGKLVINVILQLAIYLRCYKLSLDCKDNLIPFYESLGFKREPNNANYLNMRFHTGNATEQSHL